MAAVTTSGTVNITADPAMASGANMDIVTIPASPLPVTVASITCAPISTGSGAQCGSVTLRVGLTVVWRGFVSFTANAANQGQSTTFPLNLTYTPSSGVIRVTYLAVTDATTAAVNVVWR